MPSINYAWDRNIGKIVSVNRLIIIKGIKKTVTPLLLEMGVFKLDPQ